MTGTCEFSQGLLTKMHKEGAESEDALMEKLRMFDHLDHSPTHAQNDLPAPADRFGPSQDGDTEEKLDAERRVIIALCELWAL